MNPEIKKFWTKPGHGVETDILLVADQPWYLYWFLVKYDEDDEYHSYNQIKCIGRSDTQPARDSKEYKEMDHSKEILCTVYIWDCKEYTEAEMLKIIRQKAFL